MFKNWEAESSLAFLSKGRVSTEVKDQWKDAYAEAEGCATRDDDIVVQIVAPFTFNFPYTHFTTYNWLKGLRYS